jgi:hypothetical protein
VGFLENKKIPEQDKRFFFRQEYLTSIKYSLYHFTHHTNCFYHNMFYIEGPEGSGKTWVLNQVDLLCKDKNIVSGALNVRLDGKNIILSDVLGMINFMVHLRNLVVERDPLTEPVFSRFDDAYDNFLQCTLTDDSAAEEKNSKEMQKADALRKEKEKEERAREDKLRVMQEKEAQRKALLREQEAKKAKSSEKVNDAKSRLASLRSKGMNTKQAPVNSVPLIPGHVSKEREADQETFENETRPITSERKGTGSLNLAASAYTPLGNFGDKELPRMKNGQADVKTIAKNLTNAIESLKKGNVRAVDYKSILLKKFIQAFETVCANRKLVLMIDGFEKLQPLFNIFFNGLLKHIRSEFILVIASQLDMERELKDKYDTNLLYAYLQNFSYLEIEEYLRKLKLLAEPSVVEAVLDLTGGSPAGLAMLSGAFQNFKGDVFKIMRFLGTPEEEDKNLRHINVITLDNLPQHEKKIIVLLSLIRRVDFALVENIAGVFNARNLIQSLSEKYSFVEESGLPEFIKKFTRTYAKHDLPSLYEEIHRHAFEYYSDRMEEDPKNKELIIDNLYYHFRVNEESAYKSLLSIISYYISTDISFCEELIHGIASVGLSKEMRNLLNILKDSFPYVILKDYKKTLPLLEAISELQKISQFSTMQLLDGF